MSSYGAYEERYRFTPRIVGLLAIAAVFVAAAVVVPMSPVLRITTIVFFGLGGAFVIINSLARRVALRIDEAGVTLGGSALRYAATTRHVPWPAVGAVVLWRMRTSHGASIRFLAVIRADGAPTPDGRALTTAGEFAVAAAQSLAFVPDPRLVTGSIGVNGWRLDSTELTAALRRYAPHVPFIDRTSRAEHR